MERSGARVSDFTSPALPLVTDNPNAHIASRATDRAMWVVGCAAELHKFCRPHVDDDRERHDDVPAAASVHGAADFESG